jgi:hypothetical protein
MSHEHLSRHGLRLLGGIFLVVSGVCLVDPTLLLDGMEIALETPSALAEARAGYGGAFAGLGTLFWLGSARPPYRALALGIAALVLGVFTVARLLSLALDGTPNALAFANHAAEALGFVLALGLWRAESRR